MTNEQPIHTPTVAAKRYDHMKDNHFKIQKNRSIFGGLNSKHLLTWTRPDLVFVVNQVGHFMHNPTNVHRKMQFTLH